MFNQFRLFLIIVPITVAYSVSVDFDKSEVIWFPNPRGDGTLIPAHLNPSPGALAGNPEDVHFYLYTKQNKEIYQEIFADNLQSIENSNFVDGAPIKLLVHGFGGDYEHAFPARLRDEYVKDAMQETFNVILMNCPLLSASPDYFMAVENSQISSAEAVKLLNYLVSIEKASWENIHLIGVSLGGQTVGQIGYKVQQLGKMIGRITALDPALPLFDYASPENRTTPDDSTFVDVIHTAANGILAYSDPCGHVDFYPNGGRYQPGCGIDVTGSCAHSRAEALFIESVFSNVKFSARECESYEKFQNHECDAGMEQEMGHYTPHNARGIYYLYTNSAEPFARG